MKAFLSILLILFARLTFAKDIVLKIPDKLFPDTTEYSANFDGSVNIKNPQLFADGSYTFLLASSPGQESVTEIGLCAAIKKKYVDTDSVIDNSNETTLELNKDGTLAGIVHHTDGNQWIVSSVTCR